MYCLESGLEYLTCYHLICCRNWPTLLSTVIPEKLVAVNQIYKFTVIYPSLRFIRTFTTTCHVPLSQVMWIQIMDSRLIYLRPLKYPLSTIRFSNLSIYFTLPHRKPVCIFLLPHSCYMLRPSLPPWVDHPNNISWEMQSMELLSMQFFSSSLLPRPS